MRRVEGACPCRIAKPHSRGRAAWGWTGTGLVALGGQRRAAQATLLNTGISTYLWVLTNRKEKPRKGKVQLIDARQFWVQMEKSLGNRRRRIGDTADKEKDPGPIGELTKVFGSFRDGQKCKFTVEDPIAHQEVSVVRWSCAPKGLRMGETGRADAEGGDDGGAVAGIPHRPHHRRRHRQD